MSGQLDQCVVDVKSLSGKSGFWWNKTPCSLCTDENDLIMRKMIGDKAPPFFLVQIKFEWCNEYTHAVRWIRALSHPSLSFADSSYWFVFSHSMNYLWTDQLIELLLLIHNCVHQTVLKNGCDPLDYYRAVLTVVLMVTSAAQESYQTLPEQLQTSCF